MKTLETQDLVIGTGISGLFYALKSAQKGRKVFIVSKRSLISGNSIWAQGGIAASKEHHSHIQDTLSAGSYQNNPNVVERMVNQSEERVADLLNFGVEFDKTQDGNFSLTQEGGHSQRRILHIGDHTGRDIHKRLLEQAKENKNITFKENWLALDLLTQKELSPFDTQNDRCLGCYFLCNETSQIHFVKSKVTILATGGAGKVYKYTSNWSGATGDGIAIAYRAGAQVKDLEFMQFHPTCLFHPYARNFLISEALRGEGGQLLNKKKEAFMSRYHPQKELAPRDIVARSIDAEMKKTGSECVFLDMTHKSKDYLIQRFPQIYKKCSELGIEINKEPIPVVPAAHYLCGGVTVNQNCQSSLKGLFALGETACTGFHGANRLASNSLLECLATAEEAVRFISQNLEDKKNSSFEAPLRDLYENENQDELIVVTHMWEEIRSLMWNYVGIVRSNRRLERAEHRLDNILNEIDEYYSHFKIHNDIVELRNIALVAKLTVAAAKKQKHSIGIHYNIDAPSLTS